MIHARKDYNRIQDMLVLNRKFNPKCPVDGFEQLNNLIPIIDNIPNDTNPIGIDEPVFLLRATDETMAETIEFWACKNEEKGGDPKAIKAAREHAELTRVWQEKNGCHLADQPKDV